MLKFGHLSTEIETDKCIISHQFCVGYTDHCFHVLAEPFTLPFKNKSIDACLISHMLTYSHDPYWVLREIDRILIDDDWLIISGFNLLSLLGVGKIIPILRNQQLYCNCLFLLLSIFNWLHLLNYEVLYHRNCKIFPWHSHEHWLNKYVVGIGTLNVTVARKKLMH